MKVALVTGASRGLGREIALALGKEGYNVVVNYLKEKEKAEKLLKAIGEGSMAYGADVGDMNQARKMCEEVKKRYGRLDALINNAGVARDALLIKTSEDDWDFVIRTNLGGCFNTIRVFGGLMAEGGGGHIINISSYSGMKGKAGQAAYSASKAALLGLTRVAALELGMYNIRVNALLPGYMPTDMGKAAGRAMEEAMMENPLGRLSGMEEVSAFISYLLNTQSITAQVFTLDGRVI
jgi:3-oxoacyl-[acyl-carrier protein] reductase